jgi:hypothetical protein
MVWQKGFLHDTHREFEGQVFVKRISPSRVKTFLQLVAVVHIFAGLLLPFLVWTPLFKDYNAGLYQTLGLGPAAENPGINFLIGLFGPTIASWGVLFLYVITIAFKRPDKPGWWAIFFCCLVWAPYDSLLSIQHGIPINAVINLISALTILVPLFMARKYFFESNNP